MDILQKKKVEQLFCKTCNTFLADRYVEGICPYCEYEDARGDQCDKCGKLITLTDLIDPKCRIDKTLPVIMNSEHLFLNLSIFKEEIRKLFMENVENDDEYSLWSHNAIEITKSWLNKELHPRSITRDLKWGTEVPSDVLERKVFYVWFDAPIAYISITASERDDWESWWKNPQNVKHIEFMGKDNVAFHSIIFPSTLIGTGKNYTMVNGINATEYLNYEDSKFSKSRGIGVFGNDAMDSGIPSDIWRYYLIINRPEVSDSVFNWKDFQLKYTDLSKNLGNMVSRILKFIINNYNGVVPIIPGVRGEYPHGYEADNTLDDIDIEFISEFNVQLVDYNNDMVRSKQKMGLRKLLAMSMKVNEYLTKKGIGIKFFQESRVKCDIMINISVNAIYTIAACLEPVMPTTSKIINEQLGLPERNIPDLFGYNDCFGGPECKLGEVKNLFNMYKSEQIESWRKKYSESQC